MVALKYGLYTDSGPGNFVLHVNKGLMLKIILQKAPLTKNEAAAKQLNKWRLVKKAPFIIKGKGNYLVKVLIFLKTKTKGVF